MAAPRSASGRIIVVDFDGGGHNELIPASAATRFERLQKFARGGFQKPEAEWDLHFHETNDGCYAALGQFIWDDGAWSETIRETGLVLYAHFIRKSVDAAPSACTPPSSGVGLTGSSFTAPIPKEQVSNFGLQTPRSTSLISVPRTNDRDLSSALTIVDLGAEDPRILLHFTHNDLTDGLFPDPEYSVECYVDPNISTQEIENRVKEQIVSRLPDAELKSYAEWVKFTLAIGSNPRQLQPLESGDTVKHYIGGLASDCDTLYIKALTRIPRDDNVNNYFATWHESKGTAHCGADVALRKKKSWNLKEGWVCIGEDNRYAILAIKAGPTAIEFHREPYNSAGEPIERSNECEKVNLEDNDHNLEGIDLAPRFADVSKWEDLKNAVREILGMEIKKRKRKRDDWVENTDSEEDEMDVDDEDSASEEDVEYEPSRKRGTRHELENELKELLDSGILAATDEPKMSRSQGRQTKKPMERATASSGLGLKDRREKAGAGKRVPDKTATKARKILEYDEMDDDEPLFHQEGRTGTEPKKPEPKESLLQNRLKSPLKSPAPKAPKVERPMGQTSRPKK